MMVVLVLLLINDSICRALIAPKRHKITSRMWLTRVSRLCYITFCRREREAKKDRKGSRDKGNRGGIDP